MSGSPIRSGRKSGAPPAEYVGETILALARNGGSAIWGAIGLSLALLSERMLPCTSFLATGKRDAMVREGPEAEVEALVAEARALHDKLR